MQSDKPTIKAIVNEVIDEHPTIQRMATQIGGLDTRVGGLETKIRGLEADVGTLKTDVAELKTDVAELKTDVAQLKTDVAQLKTDVAELKTDVAVLKTDLVEFKGEFKVFSRTTNYSINQLHNSFHKMSVTMEEIKSGINKLIEIVMPSKQREEQFDTIEDRVEQHDHRIGALEVSVKDHLAEHD